MMVQMRNAYNILIGNPLGKTSFARLRRNRENKVKTDLKKNECVEWTHLAQKKDQSQADMNTSLQVTENVFNESICTIIIIIIIIIGIG
jgi:hypothetical protein